jgi:extracellular matrix regulatory protein A
VIVYGKDFPARVFLFATKAPFYSPVSELREGEMMSIELIHIGFGNILAMNRAIAIASPNSAPTKRIIHDGRDNGKVIDMTSGRRTKAVIFTDSGHIVLAALAPETIASRLQASKTGLPAKQDQNDPEEE